MTVLASRLQDALDYGFGTSQCNSGAHTTGCYELNVQPRLNCTVPGVLRSHRLPPLMASYFDLFPPLPLCQLCTKHWDRWRMAPPYENVTRDAPLYGVPHQW